MGLLIKVELTDGGGVAFDPAPGRVFNCAEHHTLRHLAFAVDLTFGRSDLSHLHMFTIDGQAYSMPIEAEEDELNDDVTLSSVLRKGQEFSYTFDLGDEWNHRCTVVGHDDDIVRKGVVGSFLPDMPLPLDGWGSFPEQYGRASSKQAIYVEA